MTMQKMAWICLYCQKHEVVEAEDKVDAHAMLTTLVELHEWQACG